MNRLMSVAVVAAMLAVNPVAWADSWHGQGYSGQRGSGQWHGGSGGHGNPGWHGNSNWHGNSGGHGNPAWHGNPGWHGGPHYTYRYNYGHYRPYYRPYYAARYYHPYRPYYYPYRPYYRPVGYPYPYYGYYPYGYHHNHDNHSDWPAYVAGGLIVGALAMNAYNNSHPTYSNSQAAPAAPVGSVQGRHLLRDLNGRCYERQIDANGNELRTELPASECNW